MPADWSRRALLASIGTVSLAGCLDDLPASTGDPTTETPEPPAQIDASWPMPGHDPGRSNAAPESAGPTERIAALWEVSAPAALSQPVLADGTLYVGAADGTVLALDARTGTERWRQSVGGSADAPRVAGDGLYVPTGNSVVSLDAADGTERWRVDRPASASALVAGHGVYLLSDGVVTGVGPDDGEERWRTAIDDPWEPPIFASDESVFVSSGTHDRVPWTLDAETGDVVGTKPRSGHDFPAERFYRGGTIYAVDPFFGNVEASPVDGGRGWNRGVTAVGTEPHYALSGGADRVYYGANRGDGPALTALSRTDGSAAWSRDELAELASRPVAAGECALVRTTEALRCFDPADGTERWTRSVDGIGARVVVADDLVYTSDGDAVRAFRPP